MNLNKRLLPVLFILILVIPCCFLTVFAEGESSDTGTPENSAASDAEQESKQPAQFPLSEIPTPTPASSAAMSSETAPSSKHTPSSSRKPAKKVIAKVVSSSAASSEVSSAESSEVSSGDDSAVISLPSVGSLLENDPTSSVVDNSNVNEKTRWIGFISWACIILGILVILIVVLSNRRPPRGSGRKRYRSPKRSSKKHLLNDKYYRNINH